MTGRAAIESALRDAYAARVRGDLDGVCRHFADDATFAMAGSTDASPVPVRCEGCDTIRGAMARLIAGFRFIDHQILSIIVEGSRAAVHARLRVRSEATGKEEVTETADLVTFKDGKIASFVQFCDTAMAAKLVGA